MKGVPVPRVVRTEIGGEAGLIFLDDDKDKLEKQKNRLESTNKRQKRKQRQFFLTSLPLEQDQPVVGNLLCARRRRGRRRTAV